MQHIMLPFQFQGGRPERRVYKLVLTGGPCGGKTTGQSTLATFFENLGWKVFRVPETATVLMSGGIAFGELNEEQVMDFQVNNIFANNIANFDCISFISRSDFGGIIVLQIPSCAEKLQKTFSKKFC